MSMNAAKKARNCIIHLSPLILTVKSGRVSTYSIMQKTVHAIGCMQLAED